MPTLVTLLIVVCGLAIWRTWYIRRVEHEDAARPRGAGGVLRGAEPFELERSAAPAVLLVHGAGDTPQTLRALGEFLHARGFAVVAPLLPGHGRSVREFRSVSAKDWRAAVRSSHESLRHQHPWVGLVGLSLGGALAAIEAADRDDVPALVLLAPFVGLGRNLRLRIALSHIAQLVSPYFPARDRRSVRDPVAAAKGLAFGVFTPAAARALRTVADGAFEALARVRAPTLIVQSPDDNRVPPAVAERALRRLASHDKRLEWVHDGGHVITVDFGRERVFALTAAWLESHGASSFLGPGG
jgi:carboxylesterase